MTWALDLDGVVWRGEEPIPGAPQAVARLRARGQQVVLVTNNSALTVAQYLAKLELCGVPAERADLITSAQVAAELIERGATAMACAGPGVVEALRGRGVRVLRADRAPDEAVDAVVVGWHREFDYQRLTVAMRAVRSGARLIGTNDDATYPVAEGLLPGGGSILAAVACASAAEPVVAGKPHPAMVDAVTARFGRIEVFVGDRPSTDGLMARRLGCRFALVLSGVTTAADLPAEPAPDQVAEDLAALVD